MSSLAMAIYRILTRPLFQWLAAILVISWWLSLQIPQIRIVRWGPLSIPIGWTQYDGKVIAEETALRNLAYQHQKRLDLCMSDLISGRLTPSAYAECADRAKKDYEVASKPFQPVSPPPPRPVSTIERIPSTSPPHPYYYLHIYGQEWFNTQVVAQPHATTYIHGVHIDPPRPFIVDCGGGMQYHSKYGRSDSLNHDVVVTRKQCLGVIKIRKAYHPEPNDDLQIQLEIVPDDNQQPSQSVTPEPEPTKHEVNSSPAAEVLRPTSEAPPTAKPAVSVAEEIQRLTRLNLTNGLQSSSERLGTRHWKVHLRNEMFFTSQVIFGDTACEITSAQASGVWRLHSNGKTVFVDVSKSPTVRVYAVAGLPDVSGDTISMVARYTDNMSLALGKASPLLDLDIACE